MNCNQSRQSRTSATWMVRRLLFPIIGAVTLGLLCAFAPAAQAEEVQNQPYTKKKLKEVGDFEVLLRLHEEVEVTLPVKVRAEGRLDWLPSDDEESGAGGESAAETPEATPEASD